VSEATVVFVCTGNTCRSPLAMALARRDWPPVVHVTSAGLQAHEDDPAAEAARAVARERGADLSDHRSRRLERTALAGRGWIIGMTRSHVAQLARHVAPDGPMKLGLLGAPGVDLRGRATPEVDEIDDPFGGDRARYRATADRIERLLDAWRPFVAPPEDDPS
jgi:protein-tyrosine-phosphatase